MSEIFLVNMGNRIVERRKELKITQERLAEKVDLSVQSISCIEKGKKAVRPENLANICTALKVSSDFILFGTRPTEQVSEVTRKLSNLPPDKYKVLLSLIDILN